MVLIRTESIPQIINKFQDCNVKNMRIIEEREKENLLIILGFPLSSISNNSV